MKVGDRERYRPRNAEPWKTGNNGGSEGFFQTLESTPITFEFYSHGACGTDNAAASYSRHACLVHEVLIQRHALFPVAESFKETSSRYAPPRRHGFLLRLSRNLDTLGFAQVNANEPAVGKNSPDQANDSDQQGSRKRFNDFQF